MLSHEEQSCDTGMIEAAVIVPRIELGGNLVQTSKREHWHRKSTELSSCSIDHSPDCVV